jgi:hypothetical protein
VFEVQAIENVMTDAQNVAAHIVEHWHMATMLAAAADVGISSEPPAIFAGTAAIVVAVAAVLYAMVI